MPRLPLSAWSTKDLDSAYDTLGEAASLVRADGRYHLSAMLLAMRSEINSILMQRSTELLMHSARQLSLVPPGAYDDPSPAA